MASKLEDDAVMGPRQVGYSPCIATMAAPCGTPTHGTVP